MTRRLVRIRLLDTPPRGEGIPQAPPSLIAAEAAPQLFPEPRPAASSAAATAVIDVLRATSTLPLAFAAGAREAYFFADPEAARNAQQRMARGQNRRVLLCGEREGKRIDGFDLGNSPLEIAPDSVADATLLVATTNGSLAFLATADAPLQWAVGFTNLGAAVAEIAEYLVATCETDTPNDDESACDLRVVCAGKEGEPAIEDMACAGLLAMRLMEALGRREFDARLIADGAALAAAPESEGETLRVLAESPHGRYLKSLGSDFEADVAICARWDLTRIVPRGHGAHLARD